MELLRSAWTGRSDRTFEHIEIIDIARQSLLHDRWSPFAPTNHYHVTRTFEQSRLSRWPRRSCESLLYPMTQGVPCEDFRCRTPTVLRDFKRSRQRLLGTRIGLLSRETQPAIRPGPSRASLCAAVSGRSIATLDPMKKISSGATFYYKRAFPTIWFGFIAFFVVQVLNSGAAQRDPMFLVVPAVMAVVGYFMMKKIVWNLADEVYDCDDFLLVKNRGREERIEIANIMNVSATTMMNPPQITLRLVRAGPNGNEVTFSPAMQFTLNPFARSPVAEDLIVRVDRARTKRGV